ncbi:unnamed protein product [Ectocarpus sp. CCAP 1310/34]|nr:unnamed protein product [Ectocarpus sp. CCAP 1310/34]
MSLPLATLRELQKLAALKAKGVIHKRQYEAFDLAWDLRSSGVFSEEEWTTRVDGDISGIINIACPTYTVFRRRCRVVCIRKAVSRRLRARGATAGREWRTVIRATKTLTRETTSGQMDELSLVDDDSMESDDKIHAMEIPDGFRIQASTPAALDSLLLQREIHTR